MRPFRVTMFLVAVAIGFATNPCVAAEPVIRVLALFSGKAMLAIDGQRRLLAHGETSPEGVELIDADTDRALLRVNGERISLEPGGVVSAQFEKPLHREVRIVRDRSGAYLSSGTINGRAVDFVVDTGASSVAMNEVLARRLGIDYERKGRLINLQTAAGVTQGYLVTLGRVRVGEIELRNVEGNVVLGAGPQQVLLGMSFLGRLSLENSGNVLQLRHSH